MSTGQKIPWAEAAEIARACVGELLPLVQRAKTAGSIRRRRGEVGDVEVVVEPRLITGDLFGGEVPDLDPIREVAGRWGTLTKNGERFIQVQRPDGVSIDLWLVHPPASWGTILAIRTGPASLGQHAVTLMQEHGLRCREGRVIRHATEEEVPTPEEADFFAAAGLPCLAPHLRDKPEAYRPIR